MEKNNSKNLIIYGDLISQPVRSVLMFCEFNKIHYKFHYINLMKQEHLSEEFIKINPTKKVPAIKYTDANGKVFILYESCTILRFLAVVYKVENNWYPSNDIYRKSLIDQYLDWHHSNTRLIFYSAIRQKFFVPNFKKLGGKFLKIAKGIPDTFELIPDCLNYLNELLSNSKFIVGNEISIADLIISSEIYQLKSIGVNLEKYENVWNYLLRINNTQEGMKINKVFEKFCERLESREKLSAKF